ncbi:MAG: efflux RND transporter permease subunit, partial [Hyphomicrobiaceae bacterium]|nr:efflux RND transporter permease subunit [Hyphomicrobiaceae bacterium]
MVAPSAPEKTGSGGLISIFVRHRTAANLLMLTMMLVGAFSLIRLNTQFFPTIEIPIINVTVKWTGASAEDVEANILDALEPELRFLDGIYQVTAYAREGAATISLEFEPTTDMQKAQSDVEQAVARVTTLPEASERPEVSRVTFYDRVANIAISGPLPERTIKEIAKQLRDGLLGAGIDRVTFLGFRKEEIKVRVQEAELRRLRLSIDDISKRVRESTVDLPAGRLEGRSEMQLRSLAERRTPEAIAGIEVRATRTGEKVRLGDIADVGTDFDRDDKIGLLDGNPAIQLEVQRSVKADTLKTMRIMQDYLERVRPTLPASVQIVTYDVRGKFVVGRIGILVANGIQGLVLVLLVLFILLNIETALWVAVGIPTAMLAALGVMYMSGQSINMVSMFGLIMMLGIVVDDAIVVGEDIASRLDQGMPRTMAAEQGAWRMVAPVTASSLTTMAAFLPILFIGDRLGDIMRAIPLVVIAVLLASLIECFLILPAHLRHGLGRWTKPGRLRAAFDRGFDRFRDGPFRRFVAFTFRWRYITLGTMLAALIVSFGMVAGGRVGFNFFPSPEPENLTAQLEFAAGMPRDEQKLAVVAVEQALRRAERKLLVELYRKRGLEPPPERRATDRDGGSTALEQSLFDIVRQSLRGIFGGNEIALERRLVEVSFAVLGQSGRSQGDNVAEIEVQLTPSEERNIQTRLIVAAWYRELPKIAGLERIAILGRRGGPPGRDIDVWLQDAPIEVLKKAAEELKQALTGYPGVTAIADDLPYGKRELVLELTPRGSALGFTSQSVGLQVRNAFDGAIATRFARGDEEVTVRVLRDQEAGGIAGLSALYLVSPTGERVPLTEVVAIREKAGFSIVQRRDGSRTVSVTADIDSTQTSIGAVLGSLDATVMPQLVAKYGLKYRFKGRDEERAKSFRDLKSGASLALALIYIVLAWVFSSYWRPFNVLLIVPFGIMGAFYGHYIMGADLSIVSMIGLLGLS